MLELSIHNALDYLAARGWPAQRVTELGGGVSNTVLLAEGGARRLVLKQALGKLRVEQDWFSDRQRIFRECGALRVLAPYFDCGELPEVLFEDRENCVFAMSAAPPEARTWKSLLMAGEIRPETAAQVGGMLATLARACWHDPQRESAFGDQTVFDQLRLDPYYRSTALRHPDLAGHFAHLVEAAGARRVTLVHGDWSPKNFLVAGDTIMAIDFEVIHYGDPAFDAAFLLNHLLLKSFYRPAWRGALAEAAARFWAAYREGLPAGAEWIEAATLEHLGGLLLARVDGKSPAEYLTGPELKETVRGFARRLMRQPPAGVREVFESL